MEIDITCFVKNEDPTEYSASRAELGNNAARITWANAKRQAKRKPMLNTPEQLDAMRQWVKESGGWDDDERDAMTDEALNAMFIQLVSGDMREMGLDECFPDEFDWEAYRERADGGGNIYVGDVEGGQWFYYLGS